MLIPNLCTGLRSGGDEMHPFCLLRRGAVCFRCKGQRQRQRKTSRRKKLFRVKGNVWGARVKNRGIGGLFRVEGKETETEEGCSRLKDRRQRQRRTKTVPG